MLLKKAGSLLGKTTDGKQLQKPVENQDLWKQLLNASKNHVVKWYKVKGHADDELNNLCDKLARGQIKKNIVD